MCVVQVRILDDAHKGPMARIPRHSQMAVKNRPSAPYEQTLTAKLEIGEVEKSSL